MSWLLNWNCVDCPKKLCNCCYRLVRINIHFLKQQLNLKVVSNTPKLSNCYRLFRTGIFIDVFYLICPVLQTRIGGKRFLSETSTRAKSLKKLDHFGKISSVSNKVTMSFLFFLRAGNKLVFYFQLFCTRRCSNSFWREIVREAILNFFADKVVRGNAVQIVSNFPAKSLRIYRAHFFLTPVLIWLVSLFFDEILKMHCKALLDSNSTLKINYYYY